MCFDFRFSCSKILPVRFGKSIQKTSKNMHSLFFCRNPEILDECDIDEKTKEVLLENIKRRLTPQSVKIRAGM